ncbi:hypothetical protein F0562_000815 [Nyssa sinensis]|uniref:Uncharacterized protein n=1 Tax=Nyssa sinensis TaxID=561372 RepID=A0A5J5C6A1_9ASTE|nr:hypothetical protein F0562_000815 [Nyssa sinensis]
MYVSCQKSWKNRARQLLLPLLRLQIYRLLPYLRPLPWLKQCTRESHGTVSNETHGSATRAIALATGVMNEDMKKDYKSATWKRDG